MDSVMPNLPVEITEQILLRIPARFIVPWKTVCKQWRSLISDPRFVRDHVNRSFLDERNLCHRVVGNTWHSSKHTMSSMSIDYPSLYLTKFNFEFDYPVYLTIFGSCNGLLLVGINYFEKLLLWNPIFREKRNYLPPCKFTASFYFPTRFVGLGYASSIDDYKVVALSRKMVYSGECSAQVLEGRIYSLKTGSWRTIPSYNYSITSTRPTSPLGPLKQGVHVQGSIYWDDSPYESILAFDLTTEKFKWIETPPHYTCSFDLVEIRGRLAAYPSYSVIGEFVIWTWKKEEWGKLVTIRKEGLKSIRYLYSMNNHLVLQVLEESPEYTFCGIVIYDLECGTSREIPFPCNNSLGWEVHMVETLVSPIGGDVGRQV